MPLINEIRLTHAELNEAVCDWLSRKGIDVCVDKVEDDRCMTPKTHPWQVTAQVPESLDQQQPPPTMAVLTDPPSAIDATIAAMAKKESKVEQWQDEVAVPPIKATLNPIP